MAVIGVIIAKRIVFIGAIIAQRIVFIVPIINKRNEIKSVKS
jgi:hypothetical protein